MYSDMIMVDIVVTVIVLFLLLHCICASPLKHRDVLMYYSASHKNWKVAVIKVFISVQKLYIIECLHKNCSRQIVVQISVNIFLLLA